MNLVRQPPNSNLCGQACVATICGITLDESIAIFKSRGCTSTRKVIDALRAKGEKPFVGLTRIARGKILHEGLVILKFKAKGKSGSHWVVYDGKKYYDPAAGVFRKVPNYLQEAGAKAISYLVVRWSKETAT